MSGGLRTRKFKKRGGKKLSYSGVYRLFNDQFYAGIFECYGKTYQAKHTPMITLEEHDRVQTILGSKAKPHPQKHTFAYTGLMRCGECGCFITAETKSKHIKSTGKIQSYTYYRCTKRKRDIPCSQKPIKQEELEKQFDEELQSITILPEFRQWALEVLNSKNDQEIEDRTKIHETITHTLLDTQKQLDNLTKMRYRDLITDEEYLKEKDILQNELARLKARVRETEHRAENWLELTEKTFDFATYARRHFINGDTETKKDIARALGSDFLLKDGKLAIQANEWLVPIKKQYPAIEAEYRRLELGKFRANKTKSEGLASVRRVWGGGVCVC